MFLNAGTSRLTRFWEDDLRQRIGFVGPTNAFTDEDCMFCAMGLFINVYPKDSRAICAMGELAEAFAWISACKVSPAM